MYAIRSYYVFTAFSFEITDLISFEYKRRGRNVLAVRLHPAPRRYSQVAGRKPAWHGDYWVDLVPTGIWKPVRLEAYEEAKVNDIYIQTRLGKKNSADLDIQLEVEYPGSTEKTVDIEIDIRGENFKSKSYTATLKQKLVPGINEIKATVQVPDAKLWFPCVITSYSIHYTKLYEASGEYWVPGVDWTPEGFAWKVGSDYLKMERIQEKAPAKGIITPP